MREGTALETLTLEGETQGALVRPNKPNGWGVLVLSGSSGRVDGARAELFARAGCVAFAQRWWGGPGQAPGICEIPLETFARGVDRLLAEGCRRITVVGVSRGAEAALLAAVHDPRIAVAVALSPTDVVWCNMGPGLDGQVWPSRSAWTLGGAPLPFMAYDPRWRLPGPPPVAFLDLHELSRRTFAEDLAPAAIPVEQAQAEILLVAGGADALWPSAASAHAIARRREAAGKRVRLVEHTGAGHRPVLPGEPLTPRPADRAWGGTDEADLALGVAAWDEIAALLDLPRPDGYRAAPAQGI